MTSFPQTGTIRMCLIAMSTWRLLCMRMYMRGVVEELYSLVVASSGEPTGLDDNCRRS